MFLQPTPVYIHINHKQPAVISRELVCIISNISTNILNKQDACSTFKNAEHIPTNLQKFLISKGVKEILISQNSQKIKNCKTFISIGNPHKNISTEKFLKSTDLIALDWQALTHEEYVINIETVADETRIVLSGGGDAGDFYAVQTLKQIILSAESAESAEKNSEDIIIPALRIVDKPSYFIRGVVEGFYGPPWSHSERLNLLRFFGENKLNAYIYAPKDDKYHRDFWQLAYPKKQIMQFKELAEESRKNFVDFYWAISPGLTIKYSDEKQFKILTKKIEKMCDIGIKHLAVFLDDVPEKFQSAEDEKLFGSYAEAQVFLMNKLYKYLKAKYPDIKIIFCPTQYIGTESSPYLETIGEGMYQDIEIFWTGPQVCSPEITSGHAISFGSAIHRKPLVWDNYPVNDYNRFRLNLGPIRARDENLFQYASGLFSNPMNESEASKIPLATIADYLWNPDMYKPDEAYNTALQHFAQNNSVAFKYLNFFFEEFKTSFLVSESPLSTKITIDNFWTEYESANFGESYHILDEKFKTFKDLKENLYKLFSSTNPVFLIEIEPYLQKFSLYGKAGELCLNLLKTFIKSSDKSGEKIVQTREKIKELYKTIKESKYQISANNFDVFIEKTLEIGEK